MGKLSNWHNCDVKKLFSRMHTTQFRRLNLFAKYEFLKQKNTSTVLQTSSFSKAFNKGKINVIFFTLFYGNHIVLNKLRKCFGEAERRMKKKLCIHSDEVPVEN